ncbi:D-alanyl-D-alanine carboxypeptidase family protein [Saccharococcus caldoxylosilyticus]|uniref:serine-type D-Ala-D-Ala carboxypeptidase n=2 Tax=Saccharococcus caldoxylosilyticus TaxID=81408 RepID=A0A023DDP8_9BACL|nr:D-alanyl-D-alanine carboxypeptidase family protein [Parageobacillus caldoxylosilyticus]KYD09806.1 D-alanyl-D-alanine carboxypeptidase [Parageobacillus caldoxylosilyticus]MBB3852936.1 D-alanyl-D-alanine carboxypeptidase [Parageobacillus caldoxylosilyticus]GAJ39390.1 D-alanyl-D-alanine carboxypeptidase DacB [Parageobacillus caldoxylosilyticus NBRC 107762]
MKIRKQIVLFIAAMMVLFSCIPDRAKAIGQEKEMNGISAQSAILMEQRSGRVLFEKDAHTKRRIASITKIMTAILAIESGKMNDTVTVSARAVHTEGSSIYLKEGEKIKLRHLVYGLMLRSGNDAAVAIAEHVGGSVEGFVFLMNQKAAEIGMRNTHFANPHGLDDSENHYSTAYDMALLMQYAMKNKEFRKISGTEVYRAPAAPGEDWDRVWRNKNKLLTSLYEYCTGGKTGYTKRAKRTLVTTASKGGMDLIAVTLDAPDDWNDHIAMYEYGFNHYMMAKVNRKRMVKKVRDSFYRKNIQASRDLRYPVMEEEIKELHVKVYLLRPQKEWKKDESSIPTIVGKAVLYLGDKAVDEVPLLYKKSMSKETDHSIWNVFHFLGVGSDG